MPKFPISFTGKVIKGAGQGRLIGFPTANIDLQTLDQKFIDKLEHGVYAAITEIEDKTYISAINFGPKKTFNETKPFLEVHLIDFQDDLYKQKLKITIHKKLRPVLKFANVQELTIQIQKDIDLCRDLFAK
jgi:riboflavin kinase/FMN adenylyltransferase